MFTKRGYDNVKIFDIAAKTKMSQGLLYRYFTDKEALLEAMVKNGVEEILSLIDAYLNSKENATLRLHDFIERMLASIYQNPQRQQIILLGSRFPGRISDLANGLFNKMKVVTRRMIIDAQAEGEIIQDDPDLLTILLLSTLLGVASGIVNFKIDSKRYKISSDQISRIIKIDK